MTKCPVRGHYINEDNDYLTAGSKGVDNSKDFRMLKLSKHPNDQRSQGGLYLLNKTDLR